MAGAYLLAASAYSALDIGAMVRTTARLPVGQYKRANTWKYWVTMFFTGALLALAVVRERTSDMSLELAIGFLGPGIIGIIGIMIGGVKANKIATLTSPSQEASSQEAPSQGTSLQEAPSQETPSQGTSNQGGGGKW